MSDTRNGPQQHETEPEVRRVVDALEDTARQDRGTPDPGFEDRLMRVVASSMAPDPIPAPAREHRGWLRGPTAARVALAAGLVLAIGVGVVTLTPGPTPSPGVAALEDPAESLEADLAALEDLGGLSESLDTQIAEVGLHTDAVDTQLTLPSVYFELSQTTIPEESM